MKSETQTSPRIPTDKPGVFGNLTTEQKLALVTPSTGTLPPGIGGFLMDVIDEDVVELASDVTDHYVEKNTSIQDHVALRPETVTLHGVISELSVLRTPPTPTSAPPRDSLPKYAALGPTLTPSVTADPKAMADLKKKMKGISALVLAKYENANGKIGATPGRRQKNVYDYLYQIWKGRQFVTVETAWGIWPLMVIQSLRVEQPKDSRFQSEFYATFKAIRFASDITVSVTPMESIADKQSAEVSPDGKVGQKSEGVLRKVLTANPADLFN